MSRSLDLALGTRLQGRYRGKAYTAEVVQTAAGLRVRLADGREFPSLSAAGLAVMGGTACNGRRFWKVAASGSVLAENASGQAQKVKNLARRVEATSRPTGGATRGAGDVVTVVACRMCAYREEAEDTPDLSGTWPEHCGRGVRVAQFDEPSGQRSHREVLAARLLA